MKSDDDDTEKLIPASSSNVNDKMGRGFGMIELVAHIVIEVITKFWKLCTSAVLILLLVFWFHGGILALVLLLFAAIGIFFSAQDMLLYYPDQPPQSRLYVELPNLYDLPYENHFIKTKDGVKINAFLIKHANPNAATVIYFHGNAGNIGHRLSNTHGLFAICGLNVLLVEYRGYGKSKGSPSESGLYLDAEAAMNFLLKRSDINKNKVIIFGRSLGGAVAIWLASNPVYANSIAALMVENTFTSLPDIATSIFSVPGIQYIPELLYKNKYPSIRRITNISLPTLFLSGQGDKLIPPKMMTKLHSVSGSAFKRISRFENGTHNETWMSNGYYQSVILFIKDALRFQALQQESASKNDSTMNI